MSKTGGVIGEVLEIFVQVQNTGESPITQAKPYLKGKLTLSSCGLKERLLTLAGCSVVRA